MVLWKWTMHILSLIWWLGKFQTLRSTICQWRQTRTYSRKYHPYRLLQHYIFLSIFSCCCDFGYCETVPQHFVWQFFGRWIHFPGYFLYCCIWTTTVTFIDYMTFLDCVQYYRGLILQSSHMVCNSLQWHKQNKIKQKINVFYSWEHSMMADCTYFVVSW